MSRAVVVIPARWGSVRFPGKALHMIAGRPLIQHVWERCLQAKKISRVIVATDDMRIAETAFNFGAEVSMTRPNHPSGTDRIAEVAAKLHGFSLVINVQGDEPDIDPHLIDRLATELAAKRSLKMVTASCAFNNPEDALNPNNVKVVCNKAGYALYFSRSFIPFARVDEKNPVRPVKHMGIYGYRRQFLLQFVRWKPSPLEMTERLEQLRALDHGVPIKVLHTTRESIGVDTPEDAVAVERLFRKKTK